MYILDTNTLIYYFKNQGNVAQNLEAVSPENIVISTIVLFELQVGLAKSMSPTKRSQQLQQLLRRVTLSRSIEMRHWQREPFALS